jgi:hypothetical protein
MKGTKEPRTRFVYALPHQMSELFSVKARSNGGLIVFIKSAAHYLPDDLHKDDDDIKSQKYSVHISAGGMATTVHHTLMLDGGDELDTCSYQGTVDDIAVPLFVHACADLNLPHYRANIRSDDTVFVLGGDDVLDHTVVFCLFVSGKSVSFVTDDFPEFGFSSYEFGVFSVNAVYARLNIPPFGQGSLGHWGTNLPRKNREFVLGDIRNLDLGEPPQLTKHDVIAIVHGLMEGIRHEHTQKALAFWDSENSGKK